LDEYIAVGYGGLLEFLGRLSGDGYPKQLLVGRVAAGDNGHTKMPSDFQPRAYHRAEWLAHSFKSILFCPALNEALLSNVSGNPHKFLRQSEVPSCEMMLRFGPLLWCPKDRFLPYLLGASRVRFRDEEGPLHGEPLHDAYPSGKGDVSLALLALLVMSPCFCACFALCSYLRGPGDYKYKKMASDPSEIGTLEVETDEDDDDDDEDDKEHGDRLGRVPTIARPVDE